MFRRAALLALLALVLAPAPAHADVDLDGLIERNLDALMARQLPWGGFDDPLSGPQFNYGAVALAWLAGERQPHRREAAGVTLRAAARVAKPGAFQIWLEALALSPGTWIDPVTRTALADHLRAYSAPTVGPRALACHLRADCYNNLKLVDAVATLQLVRTGLTSALPGARLAAPVQAEQDALALLAERIPAVQHADLAVTSGEVRVADAAVLSDPARNPLAYHALSAAMLMRAVRLVAEPPAARAAARRVLWALVALGDPRGVIAWMGRGQGNSWTLGASTYAALAGAAEFADEPALAGRLRRLAELTTAELRTRSGTAGLAALPGVRETLAGADDSQNTIVSNGLTLAFLHLAAAEERPGPSLPLPAETPGSTALDPTAAGVATVRAPKVWFAVHRAATNPGDARYDAGLLEADVLVDDGWVPVVGQRPNTEASGQAPAAGPVLVRRGRTFAPKGALRVAPGRIVLDGTWGSVPMRLTYAATQSGVRLTTRCPRGARLRLLEWSPADVEEPTPRGLELPDRTVRFSRPVRASRLPQHHASATFEHVAGTVLDTRCDGHPLAINWSVSARGR